MKIVVRIDRHQDATYTARVPALPGCMVQAGSRQEARDRIRTAIDGYLRTLDVSLPRELGRYVQNESVAPAER